MCLCPFKNSLGDPIQFRLQNYRVYFGFSSSLAYTCKSLDAPVKSAGCTNLDHSLYFILSHGLFYITNISLFQAFISLTV